MIKEAVAFGATIEEAQQAALEELAAPMSAEVKFEVITMPEKKVFGLFGGKQAEVRAYYEAPDKPEADKEKKEQTKVKKEVKEEVKKKTKREIKEEIKETSKTEKIKEDKKKETSIEVSSLEIISIEECPPSIKKAYDYVKAITSGIGVPNVNIEIKRRGMDYFFNITSEEDYSILIGRRGETLDSIQYLTRLAANRGKMENEFSKISINIGNYREKREGTLKDIAKRTAVKVKRYGRSIALDPMNPFERRIIHTEVATIEDVVSYSVGANADRKVIIALEEGVKASNNPGKGGNRGYDGKDRDSREENAVEETPSRAPRSDAEGLSRYGKIVPKEE